MKKRQANPNDSGDFDRPSSSESVSNILAQMTPDAMLPAKVITGTRTHASDFFAAITKDVSAAGASRMAKNSGQLVLGGVLVGAGDSVTIPVGAGSPPRPVPHFQQLSKLSSDASLHLGQFHMAV